MKKFPIFLLLILIDLFFIGCPHSPLLAGDGAYSYRLPTRPYGIDLQANTVIGAPQSYIVQKDDTLLDIARNFDLGFSQIQFRKIEGGYRPEKWISHGYHFRFRPWEVKAI